MERRDAVIFLQSGCFSGNRAGIEFDLFRIFFSLDLDETAFNRLFHRCGEIIERFDLLSVHFEHGQVRKFIVTDGVIGGTILEK